jgi:hypothetical protein
VRERKHEVEVESPVGVQGSKVRQIVGPPRRWIKAAVFPASGTQTLGFKLIQCLKKPGNFQVPGSEHPG